MNSESIISFKDALLGNANMYERAWVYLPSNKVWNLNSKCAILESDEVPPELEDKPYADVPVFAKHNDLMQVLPVSVLQEIITNARMQNYAISLDELFQAFQFYYKNDAFI